MSYTKTKIIARRIPSGLGNFPRSTTVEAHTVRGGMGDWAGVSSSGAADYCSSYLGPNGTTAQMVACVNGIKSGSGPGPKPSTGSAPSDSGSGAEGAILGVLTSFFTPPKPTMPTGPMMAPQQGMSQSTMIALGVGAVGLLAIVMLASK
jgi:hypothetical protein